MSLLAQHAAGAEPTTAEHKAPVVEELVVEAEMFRNDVDAYVRELNRQIRTTLSEELRRELTAPKIVLATNELRTRS